MPPVAVLLVAAALLVGVLLLSALSALVERASTIRLAHWMEEAGGALRRLYERPERWEAYRLLLAIAANTAPVALFVHLFLAVPWPEEVVLPRLAGSLGLAIGALATAELVNRFLVSRNPEKVLRRSTLLFRILLPVLAPLVFLVAPGLAGAVSRREEEEIDEASEEEIEAFLDVGAKEGILEPAEQEMILSVIDFGDARVRSVMTPRIDMVCAPVEESLERLAEILVDSRHSRIPLYRESADDICGVLHIRDLLRGLRSAQSPPAGELVLPPVFVPETKPLVDLLRELQAAHQQMAIVVDEYGGTSGLVTVEDLLEEIVGEIVDEHDLDEPECEPLKDGGWRLDGRTSLDRLEQLFPVDLESEPYETVGGLIFGRLGNVPEPGSTLEAVGLTFEVQRVGERRIESVIVRLAEAGATE